ncbi:hypothetical protein Tco_0984189, partial [Tanacetum coccineum]
MTVMVRLNSFARLISDAERQRVNQEKELKYARFILTGNEATSLEMLGAPASGKGYTTTQASLNRRAVGGIRLHNNGSREGFTKTKSRTLRCQHPENLLFTSDGHIKIADFDSRITVVPNAASGVKGRGFGTKIAAERGEDVQSGEHKSQ